MSSRQLLEVLGAQHLDPLNQPYDTWAIPVTTAVLVTRAEFERLTTLELAKLIRTRLRIERDRALRQVDSRLRLLDESIPPEGNGQD